MLSKATSTYNKTWGLGGPQQDANGNAIGTNQLIQIDYTGLALRSVTGERCRSYFSFGVTARGMPAGS